MYLPTGRNKKVRINSCDMLQEKIPVIGTGEWQDKQCSDFKNVMAIGDIVLVREGQKAIALCEVAGDNYTDTELKKKYINRNYRRVKVLQWGTDYKQPPKRLFSQGTLSQCVDKSRPQYQYIHQWHQSILKMKEIQEIATLLEKKKNIILQGAPGTGKTYATAELALRLMGDTKTYTNHTELMEAYEKKRKEGQIEFVTFHQSMDYEDFIEGLKPVVTPQSGVIYKIQDGVFKKVCSNANFDNFEDSWDRLLEDVADNGCLEIPLLRKGEFKVELNASGVGLKDQINPSDSTKGYTRGYSHDQMYKIYQGQNGTPKGGHDNYRKALLAYMIKEYGLKPCPLKLKEGNGVPKFVLIIDEINRGNVSKIFGELITLLEADKRKPVGEKQTNEMHPLSVKLPYSKKEFSVPSNLYIIGTMNTTDRSVGNIDYAVRRRFAFVTLKSDLEVLKQFKYEGEGTRDLAMQLFEKVKKFLEQNKFDMDIDDLMVGHSYFCAKTVDDLQMKWTYEIYPLLCEYYKDGICKAKPESEMQEFIQAH